jgi:hypothetical protein
VSASQALRSGLEVSNLMEFVRGGDVRVAGGDGCAPIWEPARGSARPSPCWPRAGAGPATASGWWPAGSNGMAGLIPAACSAALRLSRRGRSPTGTGLHRLRRQRRSLPAPMWCWWTSLRTRRRTAPGSVGRTSPMSCAPGVRPQRVLRAVRDEAEARFQAVPASASGGHHAGRSGRARTRVGCSRGARAQELGRPHTTAAARITASAGSVAQGIAEVTRRGASFCPVGLTRLASRFGSACALLSRYASVKAFSAGRVARRFCGGL